MPADARFKPQKEINRVKLQLKKLDREKTKAFPDLGRATYQAYIDGRVKDPALTEACGRLKAIDEQIREGNAEIEKLKAQAQEMKSVGAPQPVASCPYCKAPLVPGTRFCGNCGKDLAAGSPASEPPVATCPFCGNPVVPGSGFCGVCGKPLAAAAPGPASVTPPAPPPPPPPPAPPTPPPPPSGPSSATPPAVASKPPLPAPGAATPAHEAGVVTKPTGEGQPGADGGRPRLCPHCQAPIEEADATFCGECGKKL